MYEPSRLFLSFHIAGFQHWDGALVFDKLKVGTELTLDPEPDNPHDPSAIAIRLGNVKLGFVPAKQNGELALLAHYGHAGIFECRVLQANPEADPWEQVRVGIFVKDVR